MNTAADSGQIAEQLRRRQDRIRELELIARDQRHDSATPDRQVGATVDGTGRLVDLTISDAALRTPHPGRLGDHLVHVIREARRAAAETTRTQLATILPGFHAAEGGR
ncbi:hypothetical protein FHR81_003144 [Actinoalloteichus hoggarensis]|uniref:Uncharacterized protein n=1 Tax=Actinoalloteichus hoggarensis TaxID=1470176 RepID=A0A221W746_9PSEU|nr:YbaB/EbfC family nucleoid-associated protein [Actinoalloteichus hoggarensis]ASO21503.1 hypothetical protein AHOG_19405 [Actinoalloteichus hoggarensis]MBB5922092.1 hypothetical protein [Actinoalloteichus hoggarensis]